MKNLMRGVELEKEKDLDEDHSYSTYSAQKGRPKKDFSVKTITSIASAQRIAAQQSKPRMQTLRDQTPSPSAAQLHSQSPRRNTDLAARV